MTLRAENLGVKFDSTWIFRGVEFELNHGQRKALVGPSGSGKSILLKSLAFLRKTDEGTILFENQAVQSQDVPAFRSRVMYVPQRTADADGTVEEYFKKPFSLGIHREKKWNVEVVLNLLSSFERDRNFLAKEQRDLSGGERQIVALIRAMILCPEFLLFDEPTSAMDGRNANAAETLVQNWMGEDRARAFVWVTHDHRQAGQVSNEVVRLETL